MIKLPRWLHHFWANFAGYYWVPCPLCKEYIGGHEFSWEKSGVLKNTRGTGNSTCYKCKEEATRKKLNSRNISNKT